MIVKVGEGEVVDADGTKKEVKVLELGAPDGDLIVRAILNPEEASSVAAALEGRQIVVPPNGGLAEAA